MTRTTPILVDGASRALCLEGWHWGGLDRIASVSITSTDRGDIVEVRTETGVFQVNANLVGHTAPNQHVIVWGSGRKGFLERENLYQTVAEIPGDFWLMCRTARISDGYS